MKKFVSIGLLMLSLNGFSQEEIRKIARHEASFSGGTDALNDYLTKHLRYKLEEKGLQGTVYVEFTVEKDGTVSAVKLLRSLDDELDNQLLTAFKQMPQWQAAKDENGNAVTSKMVLPVRFKMA